MNSKPTPEPSNNEPLNGLPAEVIQAVEEIAMLEAPEASVTRLIGAASKSPREQLETSQPDSTQLDRRSKRHPPRPNVRIWRWGAVAAVAAAILIVVSFFPTSSSNAFARMQDAMAKVQTMQAVSRVFDGEGNLMREIKGYTQEPRLIRQEFPGGVVVIADISQRKALRIDSNTKTAQEMLLNGPESSHKLFDAIMGVLRGRNVHEAERLGNRKLDGVEVVEYKVNSDEYFVHVFINSTTNMPVKVDLPIGENGVHVVASEFVFDQKLDPALFALKAPEGYELLTEEATAPIDPAELVLQANEQGLGPIEFGFSTEQVINVFSGPDVVGHPEDKQEVDVLNYNRVGIQVSVHPELGVTMISCSDDVPKFNVRKFQGKYKGGIKIGESIDQVTKTLGEPDRKEGFQADVDTRTGRYHFDSEDKEFATVFDFRDAKIIRMSVYKTPPADVK